MVVMPLTGECVADASDRPAAPLVDLRLDLLAEPCAGRRSQQTLGRVRATVEDDVLDAVAQLGIDLVVDDSAPALTMPMSMPAAMA